MLTADLPGIGKVELNWVNDKTFNEQEARQIEQVCRSARGGVVRGYEEEAKVVKKPIGLNTVQLLKAASTGMGMSPTVAMKAAEHLYT